MILPQATPTALATLWIVVVALGKDLWKVSGEMQLKCMLSVSETGLPATMSASIIHNCRIRLSFCFSICKQTVCFFLALLWFGKRGQYRSQILSCTQTSWNHLAPKSKPAGVNKDLLANPCKLIILLHHLQDPASVALTTALQDSLPNLGYAPVLVSGRNLAIPWAIEAT